MQALFAAGFLSDTSENGKNPWDGAAEQTKDCTSRKTRGQSDTTGTVMQLCAANVHGT